MNTYTVGQIFLIEDDGTLILPPSVTGLNYDSINLVKAYKEFRLTFDDDYDFVAIYVDLPSGMPNLGSFHRCVCTNVTGINHPRGNTYDQRANYNSVRLLGLQQLAKNQFSRTKDPTTYLDLAPRSVRLHELGHQWGSYVAFDAGAGKSTELLQPPYLWHWGTKFDCGLSTMNENPIDWEPDLSQNPNVFTERWFTPERATYCPLDLYLMGMIHAGDPRLNNFYYITNLNPSTIGNDGDPHTGTPVNLTMTNVTAATANGPRVPDANNSQRTFRQAFVLLTKDINVGKQLAEIIEAERVAHTTEFRWSTVSQAVLDTYLYRDSYDGVYIKDNSADTGAEPSVGPFWDSPDIWVRNSDDNGTVHQNTIRGQDNFIYVRVRNKGAQPSEEITVNVFRANFSGTEFLYPEDWNLEDCLDQQVIASVPAAGEVIAKFRWARTMIPNAAWHPCLLAEILPIHRTHAMLRHIFDDRRIAQKNVTIIDGTDLLASTMLNPLPFQIGARSSSDRWVRIQIQQKEGRRVENVVLNLGREDWLSRIGQMRFLNGRKDYFPDDRAAWMNTLVQGGKIIERDGLPCFQLADALEGGEVRLPLLGGERREVTLRLAGLERKKTSPSRDIRFEITQRDDHNRVVGGLNLVIKTDQTDIE